MSDLQRAIHKLGNAINEAFMFGHTYISVSLEAADTIVALLREKQGPMEIPGWISVHERLPEPPAQCLVYSDKACRPRGMETATYTEFGWMTAAYFPEITHWMPLPESPKEVK